jgi:hypothetical protein
MVFGYFFFVFLTAAFGFAAAFVVVFVAAFAAGFFATTLAFFFATIGIVSNSFVTLEGAPRTLMPQHIGRTVRTAQQAETLTLMHERHCIMNPF